MTTKHDLEQTIRTYQENAEAFSTTHASLEPWRPMFERFQELQPSGRILDLGAGHCRDAQHFVPPLSDYGPARYDYVALDACKELLDRAKTRVPRVQASILNIPFANNSFDGIWACASLLHIPKSHIQDALQEMKRVSTPQATYFISIKEGTREHLRRGIYSTPRFFAFYKHEEFQEHLHTAGIQIIDDYIADFDYNPPDNLTIWLCYLCRAP